MPPPRPANALSPSPVSSVTGASGGSGSGSGGIGVIAGAAGGGGGAALVAGLLVGWFCFRKRHPAAADGAGAHSKLEAKQRIPDLRMAADQAPMRSSSSSALRSPKQEPALAGDGRADEDAAATAISLEALVLQEQPGAASSRAAAGALTPRLAAMLQDAELAEYGPALASNIGLKSMADARLLLLEQAESKPLLESKVGMKMLEALKLLKAIRDATAAENLAPHRVRALVVGCGSYALLEDLDNPPHDAAAVAALLEAAGAEVLLLLNPTRMELDHALRTLSDIQRKPFPSALLEAAKTRRASLKRAVCTPAAAKKPPPPPPEADANVVGLLFFAGHGMEIGGENLLVPSDFSLDEDVLNGSTALSEAQVQTLAKQGCVSVREALGHMSSADFYVALALLDCCRDWPLPSLLPKSRGLKARGGMAAVEAGALTAREGSIIGFATRDGNVALDNAKLRPGHSPFTAALMDHLVRTDLPLAMLIPCVTDSVMKDTGGKQVPELKTSGLGQTGASLCLFAGGGVAAAPAGATTSLPHGRVIRPIS